MAHRLNPLDRTMGRLIRAYVADGSGLPRNRSIEGNPNAPSPRETFATALPVSVVQRGTYQTIDRQTTLHSMEGVISVQWFRDGALDAADRFLRWCCAPQGILHLHLRNITFVSCRETFRTDANISRAWERRVMAELRLAWNTRLEIIEPARFFDSVPLSVQNRDRGVVNAAE